MTEKPNSDADRARWGLSLRVRLFLGMLAVTFTATAGFALAMHEFVNVLEDELLNETLRRELDSLVIDYRSDARIQGKRGHSGEVFVVDAGQRLDALPHALQDLPVDDSRRLNIGGQEYFAARRDVAGARIYLVLNVESIENLEDRLAAIGWLTLAGAILIALVIAVLFSYLILNPVRRLAVRLSTLHPGKQSKPIADHYSDRDMRAIAESFDDLIQRFHAFVARERDFTEDASHELRTPLAIALSANELLLTQDDLSPQARERAERSHDACQRMQRLVTALLFLARDQDARRDSCDVAGLLDEVLPYYRSALQRQNLALTIDARPVSVAAPAGVVDCVLHNLIENTVEHTVDGEVHISVGPQQLIVADTGQGISEAALAHLFDRRYRSTNSRGLGIGLYLVRRICDHLGWSIDVHSRSGQGTRFVIGFTPPR